MLPPSPALLHLLSTFAVAMTAPPFAQALLNLWGYLGARSASRHCGVAGALQAPARQGRPRWGWRRSGSGPTRHRAHHAVSVRTLQAGGSMAQPLYPHSWPVRQKAW